MELLPPPAAAMAVDATCPRRRVTNANGGPSGTRPGFALDAVVAEVVVSFAVECACGRTTNLDTAPRAQPDIAGGMPGDQRPTRRPRRRQLDGASPTPSSSMWSPRSSCGTTVAVVIANAVVIVRRCRCRCCRCCRCRCRNLRVVLQDVANDDENADDDAIAPTPPTPTPRPTPKPTRMIAASASLDENETSSIVIAEKTVVIAIFIDGV